MMKYVCKCITMWCSQAWDDGKKVGTFEAPQRVLRRAGVVVAGDETQVQTTRCRHFSEPLHGFS